MSTEKKKWLAFGTGVGIEIGTARPARRYAVRVRPKGVDRSPPTRSSSDIRSAPRPSGHRILGLRAPDGRYHMSRQPLLPRRDVSWCGRGSSRRVASDDSRRRSDIRSIRCTRIRKTKLYWTWA